MSQIKLLTASSGSIALEPTNTASNLVITVPAVTGTMAINGPAFSAYKSSTQSLTVNTWTKITFDVEEFDTNSNYASSRFTPTVAGYYQVSALLDLFGGTSATLAFLTLYKNGSDFKRGNGDNSSKSEAYAGLSSLVYLNGTTDYIEIYGIATSSGWAVASSQNVTYFQASMVRTA